MGSTITMTCCSSEEIQAEEDKNKPINYTYADHYLDDNIIHKSYSEITKIALQDN